MNRSVSLKVMITQHDQTMVEPIPMGGFGLALWDLLLNRMQVQFIGFLREK